MLLQSMQKKLKTMIIFQCQVQPDQPHSQVFQSLQQPYQKTGC